MPMPHTRPPPESIYAVDLDQFKDDVIEASHRHPILVDFWADWCSPCHALSPHLERIVIEHEGALHLAKVEVDEGENMKLAGHYRLRSFHGDPVPAGEGVWAVQRGQSPTRSATGSPPISTRPRHSPWSF
jgi:putative thioredoxin